MRRRLSNETELPTVFSVFSLPSPQVAGCFPSPRRCRQSFPSTNAREVRKERAQMRKWSLSEAVKELDLKRRVYELRAMRCKYSPPPSFQSTKRSSRRSCPSIPRIPARLPV
jgi:hypothetical protein